MFMRCFLFWNIFFIDGYQTSFRLSVFLNSERWLLMTQIIGPPYVVLLLFCIVHHITHMNDLKSRRFVCSSRPIQFRVWMLSAICHNARHGHLLEFFSEFSLLLHKATQHSIYVSVKHIQLRVLPVGLIQILFGQFLTDSLKGLNSYFLLQPIWFRL